MADNPFTKPSISGYNANPPPDDGSQVSANEIEWAKHKEKLGDPLNTFATAIADNTESAFNSTINIGTDQENAMAGSLAFTASELTIAAGAITPTRSRHTVDTAGDASTDDLDTINTASVSDGAQLIIRAENAGRTVVVKHGTGNIQLLDGLDVTLDDTAKRLHLERDGATWYQVSSTRPGRIIQMVRTAKTSNSTGTTTVPADNTKPQNTEGTEFFTQTFTPLSASSTLIVEVLFCGSHTASTTVTVALFKDSDADALCATPRTMDANDSCAIPVEHSFAPGSKSEITFKVRAGGSDAGTMRFNQFTGGTAMYDAAVSSGIKIMEVL